MAKPTSLPIWATEVGADITEPSLGQKQDGFDINDRMPAGWINWWMNLVHQWASYLNDQNFEGDLNIQDDLTVADDATITGDLLAGTITSTGISVSTSADILHGTRTLHIGAINGAVASGFASVETAGRGFRQNAASGSGVLVFTIPMDRNQRLKEVRVIAETNGSAASDVSATLYRSNMTVGGDGTDAPVELVASTNLPAAVTTIQSIVLNPTDIAAAAGNTFEVVVVAANSTGTKNVHRIEVDYDRVAL